MTKSPHIIARKAARTQIYAAVYGACADNRVHPFDDRKRTHEMNSWNWSAGICERLWRVAKFPSYHAERLVHDFNVFAKGVTKINLAELEKVQS